MVTELQTHMYLYCCVGLFIKKKKSGWLRYEQYEHAFTLFGDKLQFWWDFNY